MREIKFRGMEPNGTWRYGFYYVEAIDIDALGFDYVSFIKEEYGDHYRDFDVKEETVGQFTGLKDKNGKEVWENDIVVAPWHWDKPHVIVWPDDYYSIVEFALEEELTVIGNIHENGDLLK